MDQTALQLIQMIKNGANPQQLVISMLQQSNNPVLSNLVYLAQEGKNAEIETIARNIMGEEFDTQYKQLKELLKK